MFVCLLISKAFSSNGELGVQCRPEDVSVRPVRSGVHRVRPNVHAVPIHLPAGQGRVPQTHGDIWSSLAR